uniref:Amino acid transporter transmembrane domain-containing protein n=1 Tax=Craspedostauros australis TaxID=1486917 RepID=A0A7R9WQT9_9STRA|mmetsp:Transcript_14011/g.38497  ORF Transcript_14011/g.38497 Transcript_14011/m.38497 type:complete len:214 (+) Transcript_14011:71-712(+)
MAAVLCQGLGGLCNQINKVLCLPCKACGTGCESLCQVIMSPFFPYMACTLALNVPGIVFGLKGMVDIGGCSTLSKWLVINAIMCAVHIFASIHIVNQIREEGGVPLLPVETGVGTADNAEATRAVKTVDQTRGANNSIQRIKHVLCYDKLVAVYIIAFVCWIMWLGVGFKRRVEYDGEGCDDDLRFMDIAVACGNIYLMVVGLAFLCSLCCLR